MTRSLFNKLDKSVSKRWMFFKQSFLSFSKNRQRRSGRILIIELAYMGDQVILVPYVKSIIGMGYEVTVVCRSGMETVWGHLIPGIEVLGIDPSRKFGSTLYELGNMIKERGYEAVFNVSMISHGAYLAASAGSANTYGMIEGGKFYTGAKSCHSSVYNANKFEHYSERYQNLFGMYFDNFRLMDYHYGGDVPEEPGRVAVHLGAKWLPRRWPREYAAELSRLLAAKGLSVVMITGVYEKEWAEYFKFQELGNRVEMKEITDIDSLCNEIQRCEIFVGNDSGPAHLAALLEKKTIVLWGPGNFERIHPVGKSVKIIKKDVKCRPCRQYIHPERCENGENICMKKISPDEVFKMIVKLLK